MVIKTIKEIHSLITLLYRAANQASENRRVAGFGPAGGDPSAMAQDHLEHISARLIEHLLETIEYAHSCGFEWPVDPFEPETTTAADAEKRIEEINVELRVAATEYSLVTLDLRDEKSALILMQNSDVDDRARRIYLLGRLEVLREISEQRNLALGRQVSLGPKALAAMADEKADLEVELEVLNTKLKSDGDDS